MGWAIPMPSRTDDELGRCVGCRIVADINSAGWEAEEQLRAALVDAALTQVSEGLGVLLAHLAAQLSETLHELAEEAFIWRTNCPTM